METALTREKVEISKNPYVREELVIEENPITETRKVPEQTSSCIA